jgi:prophage regulatory protein
MALPIGLVMSKIIKITLVAEKTALSKPSIYRLAKADKFPKPFKLVPGGSASGWYEHEVDDWIETRAINRST